MALSKSKLSVGQTHSEVVVDNLSRTQIVQYAGASGDYNPVHTDEVFATKVAGYPTVFAHGMLGMAWLGRLLTQWVPQARLRRFDARFGGITHLGNALTCRGQVIELLDVDGETCARVNIVAAN